MKKQYSVWLLMSSFTLLMHPCLMKNNVQELIASFYLVNASVRTRQVYTVQPHFKTIVIPGINLLESLRVHTLSHKELSISHH